MKQRLLHILMIFAMAYVLLNLNNKEHVEAVEANEIVTK